MTMINTERLTIRNFSVDDWKSLQSLVNNYQESGYAEYDHKWPAAAEEIKGIVEWFAGDDSYHAVCLSASGVLIGFIALIPGEGAGGLEFNLGYIFHNDYMGHGFAAEGCRAVLSKAFGTMEAERVVANTAAAYKPSCKLLRSLGMKEIGQHTGSFHLTSEGKPVEFIALSFAISRGAWEIVSQPSTNRTEKDL